jgi:hypothetical protein
LPYPLRVSNEEGTRSFQNRALVDYCLHSVSLEDACQTTLEKKGCFADENPSTLFKCTRRKDTFVFYFSAIAALEHYY